MLRQLLCVEGVERRLDAAPLLSFVTEEASKVADFCMRAISDDDAEVSSSAVKILRALQSNKELLAVFVENKDAAAEILANIEDATDLVEWLQAAS